MHVLSTPRGSRLRLPACAGTTQKLFRIGSALSLVILLAGCGTTLQTGVDIARTIVGGRGAQQPVPERIAASPYASLMMDDGTVRGVMMLGNDDEGRLSWHSGRHVLFLCDGDQVCGTHELGARLDDMRIEGTNPFLDLRTIGGGTATVVRRYDWPDGYRYGIPVTGTLRQSGQERLDILGRARDLVRYEEHLHGPGVDGRNTYWVDPGTGRIWKSRQMVTPDIYVDIVLLKPYARRTQ